MVQKSQNLEFKECYTFPSSVEDHILNIIKNYQRKLDKTIRVLHAPSGKSQLGKNEKNIQMTNFDIDETVNPDVVGDIYKLTDHFERNSFDVVLSDPIWIEEKRCKCRNCGEMTAYKNPKGVPYPKRRFISYNLRDVLKINGLFMMNCLWNPWVKGLSKIPIVGMQADYMEFPNLEKLETVETIYQSFSSFRNVSLIWRFTKEGNGGK